MAVSGRAPNPTVQTDRR